MADLIPIELIPNRILVLRGQRVLLDRDLAALYGVTTKRLNQQLRRNLDKFPGDFLFQLTHEEKNEVVAKCDHLRSLRYSPVLPYAFTEHGAIQAASILHSPAATAMTVHVVRAFVQLRQTARGDQALASKLAELEARLDGHDEQLMAIVETIRQLTLPIGPDRDRKIGFHRGNR